MGLLVLHVDDATQCRQLPAEVLKYLLHTATLAVIRWISQTLRKDRTRRRCNPSQLPWGAQCAAGGGGLPVPHCKARIPLPPPP